MTVQKLPIMICSKMDSKVPYWTTTVSECMCAAYSAYIWQQSDIVHFPLCHAPAWLCIYFSHPLSNMEFPVSVNGCSRWYRWRSTSWSFIQTVVCFRIFKRRDRWDHRLHDCLCHLPKYCQSPNVQCCVMSIWKVYRIGPLSNICWIRAHIQTCTQENVAVQYGMLGG